MINNKNNGIQERALRIKYGDCKSSFRELLQKNINHNQPEKVIVPCDGNLQS